MCSWLIGLPLCSYSHDYSNFIVLRIVITEYWLHSRQLSFTRLSIYSVDSVILIEEHDSKHMIQSNVVYQNYEKFFSDLDSLIQEDFRRATMKNFHDFSILKKVLLHQWKHDFVRWIAVDIQAFEYSFSFPFGFTQDTNTLTHLPYTLSQSN